MALTVQSSFTAGELDPVLHERTTLAKYKTGLKTARNVIITKAGSILSRPARKYVVETKVDDREVRIYSPPNSGYLLEWGHLYVRVYSFDDDGTTTLVADTVHVLTEDNLPDIQFESSGDYVYIFCEGIKVKKLNYTTGVFVLEANVFATPTNPTNLTITPNGGPTGYQVEYGVTYVKNGEESGGVVTTPSSTALPIVAGQSATIDAQVSTSPTDSSITEMRVYRRPASGAGTGGGAFGYIGSTTYSYTSGASHLRMSYTDLGGAADYTHTIPAIVTPTLTTPINQLSKTGAIYQQRLLITQNSDKEAILASRPGYQNNFYRDYPLSSDSALKFKAGTSGTANVRRMIDADGLVVFTSNGVFRNTGALTPENLSLDRKGKWKIQENIQPLAVPGGVLFVDETTNCIRNLTWSTELESYNGEEVTIFSNHLFQERVITSWAFQEGLTPLLWVTFDDGTYASFTYQAEQQMKAWTRHDSELFVEQVATTERADLTFFVSRDDTTRYIECTIPRKLKGSVIADNPEAVMGNTCAAMDMMLSTEYLINDDLVDDDLTLTALNVEADPDFIAGTMTLSCVDDAIFTTPFGLGTVGTIFRWFDPDDHSSIDLEVTARASDNSVTVRPSIPFPIGYISNPRLYRASNTMTGLTPLIGKEVSVVVDGFVVSSPKNDTPSWYGTTLTVDGAGVITLPNDMTGAIIHVGLPITADAETLDMDTVEQAPTLVESMTINKLYIKVNNSTGLYVSSEFPESDHIAGMQDLDIYDVDYSSSTPIIGNRFKQPSTKRVLLTLPGDWESNGRVALRQVDPLHFEILSIIPDIDVLRRSDR